MVDSLTDMMHRELNLTNTHANNVNNNNLLHPHSLSRKISDHNNSNNSINSQHQHAHHHQLRQSPPMITTTDYSDPSSLSSMRVSKSLFNHKISDAGYDTDGGIGTSKSTSKTHHTNFHSYEHLNSPKLFSKGTVTQLPKQLPLLQQRSSQQIHLTVNPSSGMGYIHDDNGEETNDEGDARRRHIRLSRRIRQRSPTTRNHGAHMTHPSTIPRHGGVLATTASGRPLRLVFMRHSERVNQALGSDWFSKAFRTNSYQAYDQNLPMALPKRRFDQAYEFDAPLTGLQMNFFCTFIV
jgi:hypothetical protein